MDFEEINNAISPSRSRTKQVAKRRDKKGQRRRRGIPINIPTSRGYDSDGSRFSEGEDHQPKLSNEEKRRKGVEDQLIQSQREKRKKWESDKDVEDLTDDSPQPKSRSSFDGVALGKTEQSSKMINDMKQQGLLHEEGDSAIRNGTKSKKGKRRGMNQPGNSLFNLDKGNRRILNTQRTHHTQQQHSHPLDIAEEQRQSTHATSAEFRKKSNYTQNMGHNMDIIFQQTEQTKPQQYGKGSIKPKRCQQKQSQKEQILVTRQENPFGTESSKHQQQLDDYIIPRKKEQQDGKVIELDGSNHLEEVKEFNKAADRLSSGSSGKRKKRDKTYDELEEAPDKRHSGANANSPFNISMTLAEDEDADMRDEDGDFKMMSGDNVIDQINSISNEYIAPDTLSHYNAPNGGGRSVVPYTNDYDTKQSVFESAAMNGKSPPGQFNMLNTLGIQKMNNGDSGNKKKKANKKNQVNIGEHFRKNRDNIIDSDGDYNPATNRGKGDSWNRTSNRLKRGGMAPVADTPNNNDDWIDRRKKNDAPRKRDRKSSGQSSTSWASPRTTRSRSKPKRKVEGSTNDNAITIDSSSDESSAEDMEIDACSVLPEEFEDDEPIHEV